MKTVILLLLMSSLIGCNQEAPKSSGSTASNAVGGTTTGGTTGGGTTGGGHAGSSCHGTPQDGSGPGNSLWHFDIQMAGHQKFYPSNGWGNQWGLMNLTEGSIVFRSDYRHKVRFKLHPQPVAPTGQEYCYGRQIGQVADAFRYQKVKFTVYLRDVLKHNSSGALSLGARYQPRYIGPISVNGCSQVIDYSHSRNGSSIDPNYTVVAHAVEIDDIRSDSNCQECKNTNCKYENFYCPSQSPIRASSCWRLTMQVSTDLTQDFH